MTPDVHALAHPPLARIPIHVLSIPLDALLVDLEALLFNVPPLRVTLAGTQLEYEPFRRNALNVTTTIGMELEYEQEAYSVR